MYKWKYMIVKLKWDDVEDKYNDENEKMTQNDHK